jgi:hypothetical protein
MPDTCKILAPVTADDVETGSVILRGVTVSLDSEVGRAFILDCARNVERQMSESEIKSKYELIDTDWKRLADNAPLLRAIRAEHERRVLNGEAAREAAQRHLTKAPAVLNGILLNAQISPRHRIEAARELRQAAASGPDISAEPREKVVIHIDLSADGTDCKFVKEVTVSKAVPPPDDGEQP